MAYCGDCQTEFSRPSTLRAHVIRKHPGKLDILVPRKITKSKSRTSICRECNVKFATWSNYSRHVKNKHSEKLEELLLNEKKTYKCKYCNEEFQTVRHFTSHKKIHKTATEKRCPLCQYVDSSRKDLIKHYREKHSLRIENETIEFDSLENFQRWKAEVEEQTFASFIIEWTKKTVGSTKINYLCHRSGEFTSQGKNLRQLKKQGSNKIGGYCPAKMSVTIQQEKCVLEFCMTHVGHRQEVEHLFLSKSQRQQLEDKISAEIPLQTILDELKSPYSDFPIEHVNRVKKKDLYNIRNCLKRKGCFIGQQDNNIEPSSECDQNEDESYDCVNYNSTTTTSSIPQQIYADNIKLIIIDDNSNGDESSNLLRQSTTTNILDHDEINQSLHKEKQKLISEFEALVNAATSWEELDVIKQTIESMCETIS